MPASPMRRMMVFTFSMCCGALRPVQKNVMPVRRVEIFDCRKRQAGVFDFSAKLFQFGDRPEFFGIAGHAPRFILSAGGLIVARIARALIEIIDQMHHYMGASRLAREVVIVARQHVAV